MAEPGAPPDLRTLAAFAGVVVLIGVNVVAVRFSNLELRPLWGATIRFSLAAGILTAITLLLHIPLPRGGALKTAAVYGALAFGAAYALLYWALVSVPAGVTAVVIATVPISTLAIAVVLKMEKLRAASLAGALLAVAGVGVIAGGQIAANIALLPIVAIAVASICVSAAGIVIKRAPKSHPISTNAVGMAVGALLLAIASFASQEPWILPSHPATLAALAWLVTSSVISFALLVWLLNRWTASAASYQTVVSPLVTIAVAAALVGEPVTLTLAAGTALVLLGVYFGAVWRPKAAKDATRPS